jgi:hypothetical protein
MTAPTKSKTFTLSDPIDFEGRKITEVTITKPRVKDLKRMQAGLVGVEDKLEQGIVMAATLTGLPIEAIEEMDTDDFTEISELIADFFPKGTASLNGEPSLPKPPTG